MKNQGLRPSLCKKVEKYYSFFNICLEKTHVAINFAVSFKTNIIMATKQKMDLLTAVEQIVEK